MFQAYIGKIVSGLANSLDADPALDILTGVVESFSIDFSDRPVALLNTDAYGDYGHVYVLADTIRCVPRMFCRVITRLTVAIPDLDFRVPHRVNTLDMMPADAVFAPGTRLRSVAIGDAMALDYA